MGSLLARDLVDHSAGNAERGEDTDDNTDKECEDESADDLATKDEHHQQGDEGGAGGVDRTGEGGVDGVVHVGHQVALRIKLAVFADAVEDNHRGVDGVTDDRQDSRNEVLVDLEVERQQAVEQREDTNNQDGVVGQSGNRTETEAPATEAEADVDKHHNQTANESPDGVNQVVVGNTHTELVGLEDAELALLIRRTGLKGLDVGATGFIFKVGLGTSIQFIEDVVAHAIAFLVGTVFGGHLQLVAATIGFLMQM